MSGTYRIPNHRKTERADAPFRYVYYPEKRRDRERGRLWYLTTRQKADIRREMGRAMFNDRFMVRAYALAEKYGVPVPVVFRVWNTRVRRLVPIEKIIPTR